MIIMRLKSFAYTEWEILGSRPILNVDILEDFHVKEYILFQDIERNS